jgi:hypothetical protein
MFNKSIYLINLDPALMGTPNSVLFKILCHFILLAA